MNTTLYPMKFLPLFKNKVWGGNTIASLGFDYSPLPNCGELWALSGVRDNESVIDNGFLKGNNLSEVLEIYMGDLVGERNYLRFGNEFPILVKLIDANDKLSIQVHPDDQLARQRGMENGKTEMWYVVRAQEGAEIVDGFATNVTPAEYQQFLAQARLEDILHVERPKEGDVFFIPAGRVHAIGKGLLLAEIQQTSDCTYRIYDYNRPGDDGKLRELHTDEAQDAIHFEPTKDGKRHYAYHENETVQLAECPYFTTNLLALSQPLHKNLAQLDSFVAYLCVDGIAAVRALGQIVPFHAGECVLLPAAADMAELHPQGTAKLLEVYVDPKQYSDDELRHRADRDLEVRYIGNMKPDNYMESMDEMTLHDLMDGNDKGNEHAHCGCGHHHGHGGNDPCGCGA